MTARRASPAAGHLTATHARRGPSIVPRVALFSRGRAAGRASSAQAQAIDDFWSWWREAGSAALAAAIADGDPHRMVDEIGRRVSAVHPKLSWETGPGRDRQHTLTVTSEGDPELRAVARRWLRAAPAGADADPVWEFTDVRQPAADLAGMSLGIAGHTVDTDSVLVTAQVRGAEADVTVYHPAFADLPEQARAQVAFIVLDWVLGEVGVETWVGEVTTATLEPLDAFPLAGLTAVVDELGRRYVGEDGRPVWALLQGTGPDGLPVVAAAQIPLKAVTAPELDTYVQVQVPFTERNEGGLPEPGTLDALRALEDHVTARLEGSGRVVAHQTHAGVRVLHVYVDGGTPAVEQVRAAVGGWAQGRVQVESHPDPGWRAVAHLRAG